MQENAVKHEEWVDKYGSTIRYKGFFGVRFRGSDSCVVWKSS